MRRRTNFIRSRIRSNSIFGMTPYSRILKVLSSELDFKIYDAWTGKHGSPNQWNGQMDVPSSKVASHTLDYLKVLRGKDLGSPKGSSRIRLPLMNVLQELGFQNGQMEETLHWQLPILQG